MKLMKKIRYSFFRRWMVFWGMVCLFSLAFYFSGIFFIFESSMPMGVYKKSEGLPAAGDMALVKLSPKWSRFATDRKYVTLDFFGDYERQTLKYVRAGEGDSVSISPSGVVVNGLLLNKSEQMEEDSKGREMPYLAMKEIILKEGEFIVVSGDNDKGFDSRYYGVMNSDDNLISKANKLRGISCVLLLGLVVGVFIIFTRLFLFALDFSCGRFFGIHSDCERHEKD